MERTHLSRRRREFAQLLLHVAFGEVGKPLEEGQPRYRCDVELVGQKVANGRAERSWKMRRKGLICGCGGQSQSISDRRMTHLSLSAISGMAHRRCPTTGPTPGSGQRPPSSSAVGSRVRRRPRICEGECEHNSVVRIRSILHSQSCSLRVLHALQLKLDFPHILVPVLRRHPLVLDEPCP